MAQSSVCGVITEVMNPVGGTSERGNQWIRQTFIVKKFTNSQYDNFVALDLKNLDMIESIKPVVGQCGEFFFDAESQKSKTDNARWFTSLTCYKVKPYQMVQTNQESQVQQQANPVYPQQNAMPQSGWGQQSQQGAPQMNGWNPNGGQQGNGGWQ